MESFKQWALGTLKSWTAWFGTMLALFPLWWPQVEPLLAELLTPAQYKWLVSAAGVLTVLLRFKTTTAIPAKVSGPMEFGSRQGGFVRLPVTCGLLAAALLAASLTGCAVTRGFSEPLHNPEATVQEPPAVHAARVAIDEANGLLVAVNTVIGDNAADRVWTQAQAQGYLDESKALGAKLDQARKVLTLDPGSAEAQAKAVTELIKALHRRVAAAAREEG